MTSIEDRLARDIRAVTDGVVVTEADLESAREALDDRLDTRRQRDRRWVLAAAAVAIPALGYGAFTAWDDYPRSDGETQPASADPVDDFLSGPAPTPGDLEGLWQVEDGTILVRFSAPDVVALDDTGRVLSDPAVTGTYAIEGDMLTVRVGQDSRNCAGQTFVMRSALPEAGSLLLAQTSAGEGSCNAEEDELLVVQQVLPTSAAMTGVSAPVNAGWQPPADEEALQGVWMAVGGGHVVEMDPGGVYYVADESGEPFERGTWSLKGDRLVFVAATSGSGCSRGDRVVLDDLEHVVDPATEFLRAGAIGSSCSSTWAVHEWVWLPHEDS